ncbi:hypothetical protein [Ruminococcus flavefaciens]|uniref:hypothetical protein n=1 Tax=Ruminococcus flavefaciens TaxID=1265 RepID=UPI000319C99D|nr:hypothetical protein [Ruminococcus flavefaciens]
MKKKAAISIYVIGVIVALGLLALLVYSSVSGESTYDTANFTVSDIARLGLAAWTLPMWGASLFLMKALRLKGTLHEKQNKMLISFPAIVCTGFFIFYIIVFIMMMFR